MAIISISRGSHSRGKEVAEKVAERLGYTCLSRDVVIEASEQYNIPEIKLTRAIEDPPSVLERITGGKARYVVYIRAALLQQFRNNDIVYHGLGGHFFLQQIRHVLKVRLMAELDDRVGIAVERDGIPESKARGLLLSNDKARRQWGQSLYGVDPEDPSLYDAVVHVGKMGPDGAADMICGMATQDPFLTTPESQAAIEDLALAASVEALLVDMEVEPTAFEVTSEQGEVMVRLSAAPRTRGGSDRGFTDHYVEDLWRRLFERARGLPGMKHLEIQLGDY